MVDRKLLLSKLAVGDIFHAKSPNAPSLICLVTSVSKTTIQARSITTQMHFEFDRQTGIAEFDYGKIMSHPVCPHIAEESLPWKRGDMPIVLCTIDSVAPLPVEIHNVMLEIDQKFKQEYDPDDPDQDRFKLNEAEIRALIFVASYYPSNPL